MLWVSGHAGRRVQAKRPGGAFCCLCPPVSDHSAPAPCPLSSQVPLGPDLSHGLARV